MRLRSALVAADRATPDSAVRSDFWSLIMLCGLGLSSALIYGSSFLWPFPLLRLYTIPHQDIGSLTDHRIASALGIGGSFLLLFWLYAVGWQLCRNTPASRAAWAIVLGGSIALSILLCFVYPVGAVDLYDYRFTGHLVITYNANPYLVRPEQFPNDPLLAYVGWRSMRSVYGPLWQLLGIGVSRISGSSLLSGLLAYKFITVLAFAATSLIVRSTLLRLYPAYALAGTYLFAWSPLVLIETAVNGHNDIVMVLCMMLCFLALARKRPVLALAALSCAALVKYVMVLLLPFVAIYIWQHFGRRVSAIARLRLLGLGALALALPAVIAYGIFWDGWATVTTPSQQNGMWTTSPTATIFYWLQPRLGNATANRLALWMSVGILALAYALLLWKWRRTLGGLISHCAAILWVYLLLCNPWFQPWYLIWLVALAALLPSRALFWRTWIFALTALASYLFWSFLAFRAHWDARLFGPQAYETLMIYLPPLVLIVWLYLAGQRVKRKT